MNGVTFVFDRVMHYHRATLQEIERRLAVRGIPFRVLSAGDKEGSIGRVADGRRVTADHEHFDLVETKLGGFQLRLQRNVLAKLKATDPAVVVTTSHAGTLSEWSVLHWAGRRGVKRVAWQCGYEYNPGRIKRFVLGHFIPLFDFHLCYHSNAKSYALQHGAREDQTLVMHNTIDERAISAGDRDTARAVLGDKHPHTRDKKIVLYVGAVLEEKRLECVFDALARLARPDTMFVVVGDGPHLAILKARYADRNDWVSVGSVIEGVNTYFDAADILVLPGTGGLAINEAMAHRLPVIAGYADGSTDDLVIDGVTGFRLREGTAAELADHLSNLLAAPNVARDMGALGEQRIRGQLSFESFIDRVVGVLEAQHALAIQEQ